jgi:hypothetical protein
MNKILVYAVLTVVFGIKNLMAQESLGKNESPLFNGKEYVSFTLPLTGSLFYNDAKDVDNNSVKFDKVLYTDVALIYDVRSDELISRHPKHFSNVILVKEFVDYFTIGKDTFVYLSEKDAGIKSGYYLQIFNSEKYKSYAKLSKTIKDPKATSEKRSVEEKIQYFFKTPASPFYHSFNSINKLVALEKPHKKALKELIRSHGLQYDKNLQIKTALVMDYLSKVNHH